MNTAHERTLALLAGQASDGEFPAKRLYDWEAGHKRGITLGSLGRLCAFYDIPTAVILDRADTRYRASQKPAVAAWHARQAEAGTAAHDPKEAA